MTERTPRWGLTVPLFGHALPEQRQIVTELADLGYTDLWSAELNGIDAFTPLVLASQWTDRLRFGTAIVPVYTRGPACLAMTAATLADLAPGRFMLGATAGPGCELIARIFVCPTTDTDIARVIARRALSAYLTVPAYFAFHDWLGRRELLQPMMDAWNAGDRKGAGALIPDEVVDDLVIHGHFDHCRERVDAYRAAGLDTPVIAILPTPGVDSIDAARALGLR